MCSIRVDDATAAILCQNAHHTPTYWWRGESDEANQYMGMIRRGHNGQRPIGKLGQDARVTPLLFFKAHPGNFFF